MRRTIYALTIVALWTAASAGQASRSAGEVVVSAASSLAGVLDEVGAAYAAQGGEKVVLNFGASNFLARQIAAGARVDVFLSADDAQMDTVAAEVLPGTRVALLSNQLAIAVPQDSPVVIASVHDLVSPAIRRIAVGDPSSVPVGVYARRYLESVGLWERVRSKLVPAASARLALATLQTGAVDAAVVFRSDVAVVRRVRAAFVVPEAEGPTIRFPVASMRRGTNPAGARRFLTFLSGPQASRLFEKAGFVSLSSRSVASGSAAR